MDILAPVRFEFLPSLGTLFISILMAQVTIGAADPAQAMDSADVLPVGINSPALRTGTVSGVDQKFTSDGQLVTLGDYHSVVFDSQALQQAEPRVQQLVNVLNQFGHQNLGDALNLGVLRIDVKPDVRYFAPLHAYGVTKRLTIAVGLPIVTYDNRISLRQEGSNLDQVQAEVGAAFPELNDAFTQMRISLVESVNSELARKGYKPLADRNETIYGDVQVAALYQFFKSPNLAMTSKTLVGLPTGPADDPDDLADLGAFGETSLEEILLVNWRPWSRLQITTKAGYRWLIPDRAMKRVPDGRNDPLPGLERKERLQRDKGDAITVGLSGNLKLLSRVKAAIGVEHLQRGRDRYEGARGWDYSSLSRNTDGESTRVRTGIEYDSTDAYFGGTASVPLLASYEFSDTVAGRNVERQNIHELWLTFFF